MFVGSGLIPSPGEFLGIFNSVSGTYTSKFDPTVPAAQLTLAANRNGTLFAANRSGITIYDSALAVNKNFSAAAGGLAFDAQQDLMYLANTVTGKLEIYNTKTWAQVGNRALAEGLGPVTPFDDGVMTVSGDSRYVFLSTPTGIRQYDLIGAGGAFTVTGLPSVVKAGDTSTITVSATGGLGAVNPNFTGLLRFSSSDLKSTLPTDYTFTAADKGVKAFTVAFRTAGTQTLVAGSPASTITSVTAFTRVTPGAASQFALTNFPQGLVAGGVQPLTITANDPFGNLVNDYTGAVTITTTDPAIVPIKFTYVITDRGTKTLNYTLKTPGFQDIVVSEDANPSVSGTSSRRITAPKCRICST